MKLHPHTLCGVLFFAMCVKDTEFGIMPTNPCRPDYFMVRLAAVTSRKTCSTSVNSYSHRRTAGCPCKRWINNEVHRLRFSVSLRRPCMEAKCEEQFKRGARLNCSMSRLSRRLHIHIFCSEQTRATGTTSYRAQHAYPTRAAPCWCSWEKSLPRLIRAGASTAC